MRVNTQNSFCRSLRGGPLLFVHILCAFLMMLTHGLMAQQGADESADISIDAIRLIKVNIPTLHYRGASGEYHPFKITFRSRGSRNSLPRSNNITLYREGVDDQGKTIMVVAFEIPADGIGDGGVLFFYSDESGKIKHRLLDDSLDHQHTGMSARLINLTDSIVVCKVGDSVVRLGSEEDKHSKVDMNEGKRFSFGFAMQEVDGFKKYSPVKTLKFPTEATRFMAAITYTAYSKTLADGNSEHVLAPTCVRLYDQEINAW